MEQRFSNESIDLVTLREFCEQEGEAVMYRKGDQLEREGDPARCLAYISSTSSIRATSTSIAPRPASATTC